MDLLKDLTNQPKPAKPHGSDTEKMIDKITEAFEGLSHDEPARKTPAAHTGGLMDKISGTFEGHQKTVEKTHKDEGGLMDKISGAIGGHQKPVETHKDEGGLMDKISGVVGGHHQKPVQEGGIMGHINNALGGGQAGEKKEDALDKAVDLFQEHVLHQGPQNNESAIEQAKDSAISDSIRHQFENITGKHLPGKDK